MEKSTEFQLLNDEEAAKFLTLSAQTLRNWRHRRRAEGPVYCRLGRRIVYRMEDLKKFIEANLINPAD